MIDSVPATVGVYVIDTLLPVCMVAVPIVLFPLLNVTDFPTILPVPLTVADTVTGLLTLTVDGDTLTVTLLTTGVGSFTVNVTALLSILSQLAVME